jgi:hypothetical protein
LTFAVKGSGEYAAGVKVKIEDAKNHTYLDTTTDGPKLFVQLQPGHYKVTANREGQVLTENVTTPAKHRSAVVFRFSSEKGD